MRRARRGPSLLNVEWFRPAVAGVVAMVLGGWSLAACSESNAIGGTAREAAVVTEIVRLVAADVPVEGEQLPVVFVVGPDGTIGIEVQAGVAEALVDEVDVRFADERGEAIDDTTDDLAVREGGALVVIDEVPSEGRTFEVEAGRYRTAQDRDRLVMSFQWRSEQWTVTSTTVVLPVVEN
ncbi:hypothetical protein BH23ACT3_BH23ACT3_09970 [soil metagenome]